MSLASKGKKIKIIDVEEAAAQHAAALEATQNRQKRPSASKKSNIPPPHQNTNGMQAQQSTVKQPSTAVLAYMKTLRAAKGEGNGGASSAADTSASGFMRTSLPNVRVKQPVPPATEGAADTGKTPLKRLPTELSVEIKGEDVTMPIPKRARSVQSAQSTAPAIVDPFSLTGTVRRGTVNDFQRSLLSWPVLAELQAELLEDRSLYEATYKDFTTVVKKVPDRFESFATYLGAWSPLCLREVRSQILNTLMTETPSTPLALRLRFASDDPGNNIVCTMDAQCIEGGGGRLTPNELLLITREKNALETLLKMSWREMKGGGRYEDQAPPVPKHLLGIVTSGTQSREGLRIFVNMLIIKDQFPDLSRAAAPDDTAINTLGGDVLYAHCLGSTVPALREWDALNHLDEIKLGREILQAPPLEKKEVDSDVKVDGVVAKVEGGSANGAPQMKRATIRAPQISSDYVLPPPPSSTTNFRLGDRFVSWMETKFNESQRQAITAASTSEGFTLIKGPPGTGKTTTLTALLNALHLREYNAYYEAIQSLHKAQHGYETNEAWKRLRERKPHILVAAPSNAAVDNILLRIISDGFLDGTGNRYNPSIIRVGRGVSNKASEVSLEAQIQELLRRPDPALRERIAMLIQGQQEASTKVTTAISALRCIADAVAKPLPMYIEVRVTVPDAQALAKAAKAHQSPPQVCAYWVDHSKKSVSQVRPAFTVGPGEESHTASQMPEFHIYTSMLTQELEVFENMKRESERLSFVLNSKASMGDYQVRQKLEEYLLDAAHIVFTTMSSSGLPCLRQCEFGVVAIDEAAQGVELATLVPLRLGGRHCVLVGDPQQLSATVFSQGSNATLYGRSLFERLEHCGHKVHLLNRQYRMHPAISAFPRATFYNSELLDGANVQGADYTKPYHEHLAFRPFVFLNLHSSSDKRETRSLSNPAEAKLAVNVFQALRRSAGGPGPGEVGVITPYNDQLRELKSQFRTEVGPGWESLVEVGTVDSFQGREKSCIIVSLVRASGSGVGFLADARRMNVLLTRAKHHLCVIGHEQTLNTNVLWASLIAKAKEAGVFMDVPEASVEPLEIGAPPPPPVKAEVTANVNRGARGSIRGGRTNLPKPPPPPPPRPPSITPMSTQAQAYPTKKKKGKKSPGGKTVPPPPPVKPEPQCAAASVIPPPPPPLRNPTGSQVNVIEREAEGAEMDVNSQCPPPPPPRPAEFVPRSPDHSPPESVQESGASVIQDDMEEGEM